MTNLLNSIDINIPTLVKNNQLKISDQVVTIIERKVREGDVEWSGQSKYNEVELKCNCYLK